MPNSKYVYRNAKACHLSLSPYETPALPSFLQPPSQTTNFHPPASSKRADVAHNERSNPHTEATGSSSDRYGRPAEADALGNLLATLPRARPQLCRQQQHGSGRPMKHETKLREMRNPGPKHLARQNDGFANAWVASCQGRAPHTNVPPLSKHKTPCTLNDGRRSCGIQARPALCH